jgi:hypothetical protein
MPQLKVHTPAPEDVMEVPFLHNKKKEWSRQQNRMKAKGKMNR